MSSRFIQLFEHSPDAMVIVDRTGHINDANKRAEALFGYGRDQMRGESISTLFPGQTVPLPRRLALGLGLRQARGVAIASIEADGPAAKAGLQVGNIVLSLDGEPVTGADDLVRLLGADRIGVGVTLSVIAGSELRKLVIVPVERPA